MKSTKEELEELGEQVDLVQAELDAIAEELAASAGSTSRLARDKFLNLRQGYLSKSIEKLNERRAAKVRYAEWDQRTRP